MSEQNTSASAAPLNPSSALVIGAGQAGGPLAGALARAGWQVTLVEKIHVGGTCVNEGCTPTKAMIASARAAHVARTSGALGVHAEVRVSLPEVVDRVQGIVADFRSGSEKGVLSAGVELVYGEVHFTGERQTEVRLPSGETRTLGADYVFINTGTSPRWPETPGLKEAGALTSSDLLLLRELPEHLLILGGGYISLEFAQLYARLGSRVSVIEAGTQLLPREDPDVAQALQKVLEEEGVVFHLGTSAVSAERTGAEVNLSVRSGGHELTLNGSHLLVAVGRTPNTEALNVQATGAALNEHGYVVVNENLLAADRVYALGDVKGGPAFTHVSYDDYRIVRDALLKGKRRPYTARPEPYTLFTDPQLGRVGLNRAQALKSGRPARVYTLPMSRVARAIESGHTAGLMRAVVDDHTDLLLGVTVLGMEGGEIMSGLQLAMMGDLSASDLRDAVLAHPTLSESINNLFMGTPELLNGAESAET